MTCGCLVVPRQLRHHVVQNELLLLNFLLYRQVYVRKLFAEAFQGTQTTGIMRFPYAQRQLLRLVILWTLTQASLRLSIKL